MRVFYNKIGQTEEKMNNKLLKQFGETVRTSREAHNLTIEDLSAQLEIDADILRSIEAGTYDAQFDTFLPLIWALEIKGAALDALIEAEKE